MCVVAALSLLLTNYYENLSAKKASEAYSAEIAEQIEAKITSGEAADNLPDPYDPEMSVLTLDGYDFIGYLKLMTLGLELPVFSDWDYVKMTVAPCRYAGSVKTDDLVIAAHNYLSHFGYLQSLNPGDEIQFIDADGITHRYAVTELVILPADAVDVMVDGKNDLTLFTCTYGGENRVTVHCDRIR